MKRFRDLKIEPPTLDRIERFLHSAYATYEHLLFEEVLQKIPLSTRQQLDDLLARSDLDEVENADKENKSSTNPRPLVVKWHDLKTNPGAVGEVWVVDANKYRNPDDDLPKDFEEKREQYYQELGQPREVKAFVDRLRTEMIEAMTSLDQKLPKLSDKVRITDKKGSAWIHLTPFAPQCGSTSSSYCRCCQCHLPSGSTAHLG